MRKVGSTGDSALSQLWMVSSGQYLWGGNILVSDVNGMAQLQEHFGRLKMLANRGRVAIKEYSASYRSGIERVRI
jgi:hypothetical protein